MIHHNVDSHTYALTSQENDDATHTLYHYCNCTHLLLFNRDASVPHLCRVFVDAIFKHPLH